MPPLPTVPTPTTIRPPPLARHPAAVCLASLAAGPGRDSMRSALANVARRLGHALKGRPRHELRYAHVANLAAQLTAVSSALDVGADVMLVQGGAGRRSPDTTARDDRRPEARRAEAARLALVPWQGAFH